MGIQANVGTDTFPKQGRYLNKEVKVCFNYDMNNHITGVVVRDDAESPHVVIIRLEDGRHVLSKECQYTAI